ncbi:glycosyltransferase family 2 protein [Wohlfahrtiimonas chitiniclastica]|uniref:glycosyltransferase family 2 protein n=1 Tax=Wohlfahrtiimonas chitiniclastica TaxID=400946 RepID=UPI001BCDB7F3|nr:glycosyltransferase [Wohlfahrtiimonas chitiniclastica]MBS7818547.1 glycosyltransferase [Wohlfahrtiimonas chitiniclastica]
MSMPLVTVVIPCYNHEKYIQDCIQSVINQRYRNIELIIIDDGSTDNSVEKIKEMLIMCQERFLKFEFRTRVNKGVSATLNEALYWASGKYISPIASDDQMLPNKIKMQVEELEQDTSLVAVFGGIHQIDERNNIVRTLKKPRTIYSFDDIAKFLCFLQAPTQLIRTNILRKIGGYNQSYKIEDWSSYLQLTRFGNFLLLPDVLALYRRHPNNSSKNIELMHEKIKIMQDLNLSPKDMNYYMSFIYLSLASDCALGHKKQSFLYLIRSVVLNKSIILKKRFLIVFIKNIMPSRFLSKNK